MPAEGVYGLGVGNPARRYWFSCALLILPRAAMRPSTYFHRATARALACGPVSASISTLGSLTVAAMKAPCTSVGTWLRSTFSRLVAPCVAITEPSDQ